MTIDKANSGFSELSFSKPIGSDQTSETNTPQLGNKASKKPESQHNVQQVAKRILDNVDNPISNLLAKTEALRNQVQLAISKSTESLRASKDKIAKLKAQKSAIKDNPTYGTTLAKSIISQDGSLTEKSMLEVKDTLAKAKAEYKLLKKELKGLEAKHKGLNKAEDKMIKELAKDEAAKTDGASKHFFSSTGIKTPKEEALEERARKLEKKLDATFRQIISP